MKKQVFICLIIFLTLTGFSQKKVTHVASRANNSCNGDCTLLNIGELDGNPSAIIWATPVVENGVNANPHPIGLYYFKDKWSIFNLDQKPIPEGSKFTVEYVTKPDDTHFQYALTAENLQKDGSAFIDHPALNNNPSAKFNYFPSWDPNVQRGITSRESTTVLYDKDAGKWVLSYTNKKPLSARFTYNIVLSSSKSNTISPVSNATEIKEIIIAPSSQSVSGPLVGMYMGIMINGTQLPGDNPAVLTADKTRLYGFEMGAAKPAPPSKIRKTYELTTIRIRTGVPATIPLFNAFVNNQPITLTIDTYSNNAAGAVALNYTVKLTGVVVLGFKQVFEDPSLHSTAGAISKVYDEIKIIFTKIEYMKDGVPVEDVL
jgi:hypothetical protein